MKRKILLCLLMLFVLGFNTISASAHTHPAYQNETELPEHQADWMSYVSDTKRLSDLSIPGTHGSLSNKVNQPYSIRTQGMNLSEQLNSGIRYVDIGLGYEGDSLLDAYFQFNDLDINFGEILKDVNNFLMEYPSETVLMRLTHHGGKLVTNRVFDLTVKDYLSAYSDIIFDNRGGTYNNPTLKDMRGKLVILRDYNTDLGISFKDDFEHQDSWYIIGKPSVYKKWEHIRDTLVEANNDYRAGEDNKFINHLSGNGPSADPYFVASGHTNPSTDAERLSTGLSGLKFPNSYPDFPRLPGDAGTKTIFYEGTNVLTDEFIINNKLEHVGILPMDFPGHGLIKTIVELNY